LSTVIHVAHAVLAGTWLGGVVFTTAVVSPALKATKWANSERVLVNGQYPPPGNVYVSARAEYRLSDRTLSGHSYLPCFVAPGGGSLR
jgi:hypothetical protein